MVVWSTCDRSVMVCSTMLTIISGVGRVVNRGRAWRAEAVVGGGHWWILSTLITATVRSSCLARREVAAPDLLSTPLRLFIPFIRNQKSMNIRIANEKVPGIKDPLFKRALDAHVPVEIPTNSTEKKALAKCSLLVSPSLKVRGDPHCAGIECCALAFVTVVVDGLLTSS